MNDLISIVIPLYNKEKAINKTILSVLKQTYINWELIIVDDGSTDRSADVVRSFSDKRIFYYLKKNGGVSSARNYGVKKAKGEWIIFLDADDCFLPNALNILYELVVKEKKRISTANFILKRGKNELDFCKRKNEVIISNNYRAWFFRTFFPRTGNTLFHYTVLKELLFDETLNRYEDAKFMFDVFREYKIAYSPKLVMVYLVDNAELSHRVSNIQKDFIFNMKFKNKSFWEKIVLSELLLKGNRTYPEYKNYLNDRYKKLTYLKIITKLFLYYRFVYNRLLRNI